jgi:hypothetical protein
MRMADHNEVASVDVVGDQPGARRSVDSVDVGIEEDYEFAKSQTERSTAVPVKRCPHPGKATSAREALNDRVRGAGWPA